MKWNGKGIGWLIAGALICVSAFPGDDIADIMSTVMIGLVFIAIFLMKQRFQPRGLGWFIAGGILLAFCVDCLFNIIGGFISRYSIVNSGDMSDMLIAFILACGFMFMFYRSNRRALEDVVDDMDSSEESEFPYQEEVFREETVTVETRQTVTPEEDKTKVDFEVSDSE